MLVDGCAVTGLNTYEVCLGLLPLLTSEFVKDCWTMNLGNTKRILEIKNVHWLLPLWFGPYAIKQFCWNLWRKSEWRAFWHSILCKNCFQPFLLFKYTHLKMEFLLNFATIYYTDPIFWEILDICPLSKINSEVPPFIFKAVGLLAICNFSFNPSLKGIIPALFPFKKCQEFNLLPSFSTLSIICIVKYVKRSKSYLVWNQN